MIHDPSDDLRWPYEDMERAALDLFDDIEEEHGVEGARRILKAVEALLDAIDPAKGRGRRRRDNPRDRRLLARWLRNTRGDRFNLDKFCYVLEAEGLGEGLKFEGIKRALTKVIKEYEALDALPEPDGWWDEYLKTNGASGI